MEQVLIRSRDPLRFADLIGPERAEHLATTIAEAARARLDSRSVINVNSTAAGGGVAEMLHVLLGYVRGVGLDVRWLVIEADAPFFVLTKRVHNHLYGGPGDGGPLGEAEHRIYADTMETNRHELAAWTRAGDVVVLHDPQTAGLAEHLQSMGCRVVWRCHVGIDEHNEHSTAGWDFLRRYLEPFVDHYVFTDARFPPDWVPEERCSIIWPSIDPFSPKNQEMSDAVVEAILTHVGIVAGRGGETTFERLDGSAARVESYCDIIRTGPAPSPETPLIVQISRWDRMKDMAGVMSAFESFVDSGRDAGLVLAGPVVSAVADDPEGGEVLQECWSQWRQLPHADRSRVQLVCLPMHDLEENAAIVNALQRHATIVSQKSLAEGFGLTVAEAMLKGTPVVASAVGGIVNQIVDGQTGRLIADPADLQAYGDAVRGLLDDPELAERLGAAGRARALEMHLGDTHLNQWLHVLDAVLSAPDR